MPLPTLLGLRERAVSELESLQDRMCPATGKACIGLCKGPKQVEFLVNGRPSNSFPGVLVCSRLVERHAPSPTSTRSILGEKAMKLIDMDD